MGEGKTMLYARQCWGSGASLTPGSGMCKKSRSGSFLGLKYILKFFDADRGSGIFLSLDLGRKNFDPRSGINIPDPQQ
jgi:hypothetical protein